MGMGLAGIDRSTEQFDAVLAIAAAQKTQTAGWRLSMLYW